MVTLLGLLFAFGAALEVSKGHLMMALLLWWVGRLFDGTDGIYARKIKQSSPFGAFLDMNCDMISYASIIFGFFLLRPDLSLYWVMVLMLYIFCITGAVTLGQLEREKGFSSKDNRGLRLGAGLAEGGETGIYYSLCFLFPENIVVFSQGWIFILFITIISRFILAYQYDHQ